MRRKIEQVLWLVMVGWASIVLLASALGFGAPEQTPQAPPVEPVTQEQLEGMLDGAQLKITARSECIREPALNEMEDTRGRGSDAAGYNLARLCGDRAMSPIDAFWHLESQGIYAAGEPTKEKWAMGSFEMASAEQTSYAFSAEGAQTFLTELLIAAQAVDDGLDLEPEFLGWNGAIDRWQIHEDEQKGYYAYLVCYGDRSAHFLCFLLGPDSKEAQIGTVELQSLNLRYAEGGAEGLHQLEDRGTLQTAVLMAAAEQLLTGGSRANQGAVPGTYALHGWQAAIERCRITGSGEEGMLLTYRLHLA